jgi:CMP-2-keto-3-deoxyoctulosonic acid synthetase
MKILEQGFKMNLVEIKEHEIGVDTMDDYLKLKSKYENIS